MLPAPRNINIHCHKPSAGDSLEIVSIDTMDFFPNTLNENFYSVGIHPWFIEQQDWQAALDKIVAVGDDQKLLAIGECGLDKTITTHLTLQTEVFCRQIELAERLGKPLIIHCVRAFNELMQLKKARKATSPWLIHGFNGNAEIARQLLKQGCYLTLGKALLREGSNASQVLSQMPLERLFLETDTANVSISEIYAAAAKIAGLNVATLQQQILSNFKRVFLND